VIWILVLHMHLGLPARVIAVHGDSIECFVRSINEVRWDPLVRGAECLPWNGDEA